MKAFLIYLGGGHLPLVPSRNLSKQEAEKHGIERLVKSGLYKLAAENKVKPRPAENKVRLGGSENKAKE